MSVLQDGRPAIEFWFDFASGYGYFAALEIDALAERYGRTVLWRPFTLGAAFKVTGAQGLSRTPLKREYARHDWRRLSRLKGVPFTLPADHPKTGLPALRAFCALERKDARAAARFAKHAITGYFADALVKRRSVEGSSVHPGSSSMGSRSGATIVSLSLRDGSPTDRGRGANGDRGASASAQTL
jgi:2-hydroxychromene-2-carboxylate isomerase